MHDCLSATVYDRLQPPALDTGRGKLRVLRIGEPAKVRSCLKDWTLKAQLAKEVALDSNIQDARREQQNLRRKLRNSRRKNGEYMEWYACTTTAD
jgi:hypothetical protein